MATVAQIEANRKNALKSTGPNTAAGKARSRFNGLVHGMRAEQIVLPHEDPAEFQAELDAWDEDWKPPTAARRALVERGAVAAWRLRRSVGVETRRLEGLGNDAVAQFEAQLAAEIEEGLQCVRPEPGRALSILNRTYEGIQTQVTMWNELAEATTSDGGWHSLEAHHTRLLNLLGWPTDASDEQVGAAAVASRQLMAHNTGVTRLEPGKALAMTEAFRVFIDEEIDTLLALRNRFVPPNEVRKQIAQAAYLDASPEGKCLMRYEAQHDRSLRSSIAQLIQLTRTGADLEAWLPEAEVEAPTEPNKVTKTKNKTIYADQGPRSDEIPHDVRALIGFDAMTENEQWEVRGQALRYGLDYVRQLAPVS